MALTADPGTACAADSPAHPGPVTLAPIALEIRRDGVLMLEAHGPVPADGLRSVASSRIVSVVEQMESLKAWADYVSLAATAELTRREEAAALEDAGPDASTSTRSRARTAAHSATADELVLATGIGYHDALSRVLFSIADSARVGGLRDRLCAGRLPWHRARILHEDCRDLPPKVASDVADGVLAPSPGGAALSGGLFRQRLSRRLARLNDTATTRAHALSRRALHVNIDPDGTGTLTLTAAAARLRGAHQRIDTIARRLRAAGSTRTLAQLRSDIALDLMLYGQIPHPTTTANATAASADQPLTSSTRGDVADVSDVSAFDPASTACSFDPALFGQQLPPAHVSVTVGLSTLLGLDHEPGLLGGADGHDYLDADAIRAAAFAAGSTWRRLVTDPLTGHAHELSTTRYRPGDPLTRAVWARDQTCRVPGCTTPAERCDLDHDIDHDRGGATDLSNVSAKHRRHHNHKTSGRWHTQRDIDPGTGIDTVTWTTGAGRTYTSHPADYRAMPTEPSYSRLETSIDLILAETYLRPVELHPDAYAPDLSLEEKPPPPPQPPPTDPGPPPF